VDTLPPEGTGTGAEEPHYRLPAPLRRDEAGLPVASAGPRIPRALRAFNGMPPDADEPTRARRLRRRDQPRTIRDLLLDSDPPEDTGLVAGLRSAWDRLRRSRPDEEA
jgi:hypothetical protein